MPIRQSFPACCGADIIYSLGISPEQAAEYERQKERPFQFVTGPDGKPVVLATMRQEFEKLLEGTSFGPSSSYPSEDHGYLVILTNNQFAWLPTLKELGFVFACKWNNSIHGNRVNYLFVLPKQTSKIYHHVDPLTPPKRWLELPEPVQKEPEVEVKTA